MRRSRNNRGSDFWELREVSFKGSLHYIYLRWWGRKRGRHLAAGEHLEHLEHLEEPSEGIWNKPQQC